MAPETPRLFVTPAMFAALDERQQRTASLLVRAYHEEAHLGRSPNPLTPELAPYRRLLRRGS